MYWGKLSEIIYYIEHLVQRLAQINTQCQLCKYKAKKKAISTSLQLGVRENCGKKEVLRISERQLFAFVCLLIQIMLLES